MGHDQPEVPAAAVLPWRLKTGWMWDVGGIAWAMVGT